MQKFKSSLTLERIRRHLASFAKNFLKAFDPITKPHAGAVEVLSLRRVSGWAIAGSGSTPTQVAVLVAGQVVAGGTASGRRPDVSAAGFPTERCGFDIDVDLAPRDLFANNVRVVIWSRSLASRAVPILPSARPWALGFWDESQQPIDAKWLSLAEKVRRSPDLLPVGVPSLPSTKFLLEGPVGGDYSISIVNRNFAKALLACGHQVSLTSDDKRLEDDKLFNAEKELVNLYDVAPKSGDFPVHSVNTWPPETRHMEAELRALHCYAWEESAFPAKFMKQFNEKLNLVCTTSQYTKAALINSGLTVPTYVTGNGIDPELLLVNARPRQTGRRFRFLHLSSCFPRKGVDKLVQAFVEEFAGRDAELYIKTFDNPHNNVREIVSSFGERSRNIIVDMSHLTTDEIRKLYLNSDCLVVPSRGEGFLLPAAEAMAIGLPVITTDAGGQSDFCDNTTAWLVSSRAEQSATHMSLERSYWYEPDLRSLRHQMRTVHDASDAQIRYKTEPARTLVRQTYRWDRVAARYLSSLAQSPPPKGGKKPRLALISTWNQRCGIATYSAELHPYLQRDFDIRIISEISHETVRQDEDFVSRGWRKGSESLAALADSVIDGEFEAVLIQHHPAHFNWNELAYLIDCVVQGGRGRIKVFCQLHSTAAQSHAIEAARLSLARADVIFAHTISDVETLGAIAADTRVAVVPHGIPKPSLPSALIDRSPDVFHVGSFGFCMPHKGIVNHIRCLAIVKERIPGLKATLLHSVNDDEKTVRHALEVYELIKRLSLDKVIEIDFRFLEKNDVVNRLQACDLIVLPYEKNMESASGAIRDVLGINVPILTTAISTFSDVSDVVFQAETNHPFELAHEIMKLHADQAYRLSKREAQIAHTESNSWENAASRMSNIMLSAM